MPAKPRKPPARITLWEYVRSQLRDDALHARLDRMEHQMASEAEQFSTMLTKLNAVHADVRAKLDQVRAETSPEGQARLDEVNAALDSFVAEIGDADGSDSAAPAEATEPVVDENGNPTA